MITLCKIQVENPAENGFTQIDNSITQDNITDLSIEAYGVLTKCLSHKIGFMMDWTKFEEKHHISNKKRLKALNELENKGHCIRIKLRNGRSWIHGIIFFACPLPKNEIQKLKQNVLSDLDNNTCNLINKLSDFRILISKNLNEIIQIECPKGTIPEQSDINNTNIDKTNYNNTKENNTISGNFRKEKSVSFNSFSNINMHESCIHDSTNVNSSSLKNEINEKEHAKENITNPNNSQKTITVSCSSQSESFKDTLPDNSTTKNKQECLEIQEKQVIAEVLLTDTKKLSEQTEKEKAVNTIDKQLNKLEALNKEIDTKLAKQKSRESLCSKIFEIIDNDWTDTTFNSLFKDLVTCLTEKGIAVTTPMYRQLKNDLTTLGKDDAEKKEMLKVAIAYGMPIIKPLFKTEYKKNSYVSNTIKHSSSTVKPLSKEELPEDAFELARDENGNFLTF